MKISVSNIAWKNEYDEMMYEWLADNHIEGLEIAPTRILDDPYHRLEEAEKFASNLKEQYGIVIPSMQSIWYGRTENIFESETGRNSLLEYTKKAIDFAQVTGCRNLVFGCPRNRNTGECKNVDEIAIGFFKQLGDYASEHDTVLAMEANPTIYNTNYINRTEEALELIEKVGSEGFKLNLDIGTVICNSESIDWIDRYSDLINHVHISEPGLNVIEKRELHKTLEGLLKKCDYKGFVSLEMKTVEDIVVVKDTINYMKEIFA